MLLGSMRASSGSLRAPLTSSASCASGRSSHSRRATWRHASLLLPLLLCPVAVPRPGGQPRSRAQAVVKPVEGAGSDGVSICDSADEVRAAFARLEGTKNVLGITCYQVLLQEYLKGDEYVVDTVSRNGVHK